MFEIIRGCRIAANATYIYIYICIYIHTQTQLFGIPNLDSFWKAFGEVLEMILKTKSSKNIVFYNGF